MQFYLVMITYKSHGRSRSVIRSCPVLEFCHQSINFLQLLKDASREDRKFSVGRDRGVVLNGDGRTEQTHRRDSPCRCHHHL